MKKHLDWPEDERICKLHDPDEGEECPGCCNAICPENYMESYWSCIWKIGHMGEHTDIWCREWNASNKLTIYGRCHACNIPIATHRGLNCDACMNLDKL